MKAQIKETNNIAALGGIKILDKKLAIYAEQALECERVMRDAKAHKQLCMEKLQDAMGNHAAARVKNFNLIWSSISYKAQPEKVIPAKEAYIIRKKTLGIKQI